jgi:DNA topoisomerase-2
MCLLSATNTVLETAFSLQDVQVYLNGERLALKNFQDYCELYLKDKQLPHAYEKANDRWEVCIAPNGEGYPLQVSL